jgi:hypothetical protein
MRTYELALERYVEAFEIVSPSFRDTAFPKIRLQRALKFGVMKLRGSRQASDVARKITRV